MTEETMMETEEMELVSGGRIQVKPASFKLSWESADDKQKLLDSDLSDEIKTNITEDAGSVTIASDDMPSFLKMCGHKHCKKLRNK